MTAAVDKARWFPEMPPRLDGEKDGYYTRRLLGHGRPDLTPYDHRRNRQCAIGYHGECSERHLAVQETWAALRTLTTGPFSRERTRYCECPCHTELGQAQLRVQDLEDLLAAGWMYLPADLRERAADIGASIIGKIIDANPGVAADLLHVIHQPGHPVDGGNGDG